MIYVYMDFRDENVTFQTILSVREATLTSTTWSIITFLLFFTKFRLGVSPTGLPKSGIYPVHPPTY